MSHVTLHWNVIILKFEKGNANSVVRKLDIYTCNGAGIFSFCCCCCFGLKDHWEHCLQPVNLFYHCVHVNIKEFMVNDFYFTDLILNTVLNNLTAKISFMVFMDKLWFGVVWLIFVIIKKNNNGNWFWYFRIELIEMST